MRDPQRGGAGGGGGGSEHKLAVPPQARYRARSAIADLATTHGAPYVVAAVGPTTGCDFSEHHPEQAVRRPLGSGDV